MTTKPTPREPTKEMYDAASNVDRANLPGAFRREVWRVMWDAAPAPTALRESPHSAPNGSVGQAADYICADCHQRGHIASVCPNHAAPAAQMVPRKPVPCPDCRGSGIKTAKIKWCPLCNGAGKVNAEPPVAAAPDLVARLRESTAASTKCFGIVNGCHCQSCMGEPRRGCPDQAALLQTALTYAENGERLAITLRAKGKAALARAEALEKRNRDLDKWNSHQAERIRKLRDERDSAIARTEAAEKAHQELLYAVSMKHPNETRHQTALRYIQQAERQVMQPGCDAALKRTP